MMITIGGATHKKLIKEGVLPGSSSISSPAKSPTKAPTTAPVKAPANDGENKEDGDKPAPAKDAGGDDDGGEGEEEEELDEQQMIKDVAYQAIMSYPRYDIRGSLGAGFIDMEEKMLERIHPKDGNDEKKITETLLQEIDYAVEIAQTLKGFARPEDDMGEWPFENLNHFLFCKLIQEQMKQRQWIKRNYDLIDDELSEDDGDVLESDSDPEDVDVPFGTLAITTPATATTAKAPDDFSKLFPGAQEAGNWSDLFAKTKLKKKTTN
jgi:hypothetical protein